MNVFIGIDGGGSTTRAAVGDPLGAILKEQRSGPSNWSTTSRDLWARHVFEAIVGLPPAQAVCGCFAGLLTKEDIAAAESMLMGIAPGSVVRCAPDYEAALAACEPDVTCCVLAGTGSLVCSYEGERVVKSGGGGYLLGDSGSATAVGSAALKLTLIGSDAGHEPSEGLKEHIRELLGSLDRDEALSALYRSEAPAALAARVARAVELDAEGGLPYALDIAHRQMDQLAVITLSHLGRYHGEISPWVVALAGGLWETGPIFADLYREALSRKVGNHGVEVRRLEVEPVLGALRLAARLVA